jgi:hypothetical protein
MAPSSQCPTKAAPIAAVIIRKSTLTFRSRTRSRSALYAAKVPPVT